MPIVAAVDQSERAGPVINQARELANVYEGELLIVHVRDPSEALTVKEKNNLQEAPPGFGIEAEDIDIENPRTGINRARESAATIATEAAERAQDPGEFQAVGLLGGDPAEEILAYSEEHDAEFIVVSARKRSSLGQALFGSVTQSLLLNTDRPIVAVPHDVE